MTNFANYSFPKWPIFEVTNFRSEAFLKWPIFEVNHFRSEPFSKCPFFEVTNFRSDPFPMLSILNRFIFRSVINRSGWVEKKFRNDLFRTIPKNESRSGLMKIRVVKLKKKIRKYLESKIFFAKNYVLIYFIFNT